MLAVCSLNGHIHAGSSNSLSAFLSIHSITDNLFVLLPHTSTTSGSHVPLFKVEMQAAPLYGVTAAETLHKVMAYSVETSQTKSLTRAATYLKGCEHYGTSWITHMRVEYKMDRTRLGVRLCILSFHLFGACFSRFSSCFIER